MVFFFFSSRRSERLVVSIAASVPNLEQLTLVRISRSAMHAPELFGVYPFSVPLVVGDSDIEDHPQLGSALCLPSLLRIPSLRKLTIRDTHLGDYRWLTTPAVCCLEVLDLGGCSYETEDINGLFIERIISSVGSTVGEGFISTAIIDTAFAQPSSTPLRQLRKLHITPFFPIDSVVDTITNLSGSPIEALSVQCFEDDVLDVCSAIEHFLSLRVERGPNFYINLIQIEVSVVSSGFLRGDAQGCAEAIMRLQELCIDLHLDTIICDLTATLIHLAEPRMHRLNGSACTKDSGRGVAC
jgi:hypothetical protein